MTTVGVKGLITYAMKAEFSRVTLPVLGSTLTSLITVTQFRVQRLVVPTVLLQSTRRWYATETV